MKGDTNGEGQNFSERRFVKILAGGRGIPPSHPPPPLGETLVGGLKFDIKRSHSELRANVCKDQAVSSSCVSEVYGLFSFFGML